MQRSILSGNKCILIGNCFASDSMQCCFSGLTQLLRCSFDIALYVNGMAKRTSGFKINNPENCNCNQARPAFVFLLFNNKSRVFCAVEGMHYVFSFCCRMMCCVVSMIYIITIYICTPKTFTALNV